MYRVDQKVRNRRLLTAEKLHLAVLHVLRGPSVVLLLTLGMSMSVIS